jgi:hypothetical protein
LATTGSRYSPKNDIAVESTPERSFFAAQILVDESAHARCLPRR